MRLWITRPRFDGEAFARSLRERGHEPIVEPLMDIVWRPPPLDALNHAGLIVATSRNALRALKDLQSHKLPLHTQLLVVGPGTAKQAVEIGFKNVIIGPGYASGLPKLISDLAEKRKAQAPHVAILRGKDVAFDLAGALNSSGVSHCEHVLYEAIATAAPSPELTAQISAGEVDGVVLFSARTAKVYVARMKARGVDPAASQLRHFCMSEAVASELVQLPAVAGLFPANPDVKEMLKLIG